MATIALAVQQCLLLTCLYVLTSRLPHTGGIAHYSNVVFKVFGLLALSKSVVLIFALRFLLQVLGKASDLMAQCSIGFTHASS